MPWLRTIYFWQLDGKVMDAVGKCIKEERQRLWLTQQTIADLTLATRVTQIKYEAGTTVPNASHLALSVAEGADVLYLLAGRHALAVRQIDKNAVALAAEAAALLANHRSATPIGQAAKRQDCVVSAEPAFKRRQRGER